MTAADLSRRALVTGAFAAALATALTASRRASADDAPLPWLSEIPVKGLASLDGPLLVTFACDDRKAVAAAWSARGAKPQTSGDTVSVTLSGYVPCAAEPVRNRMKPSFLIDFDEPAFAPVVELCREKYGASPAPAALRQIARGWIAKKSYTRGYDVASVVARRQEGDCTEHAVLLTALFRAFQTPARVVHGVFLLTREAGVAAGQHAWCEAYVGGAWRAFDAAMPGGEAVSRIAFHSVGNEGYGFGAAMAAQAQRLIPRAIALASAGA